MTARTRHLDDANVDQFRRLHDHAWAVIEGLRETGIEPHDALFVLMLALTQFITAVPGEQRQDMLEHVTSYLQAMARTDDGTGRPRCDA